MAASCVSVMQCEMYKKTEFVLVFSCERSVYVMYHDSTGGDCVA